MIGCPMPSGNGEIPPIALMPSFSMDQTTRFTRVAGGFVQRGKVAYVNMLLKLNFNLVSSAGTNVVKRIWDTWDVYLSGMPVPVYSAVALSTTWLQEYSPNYWSICSYGIAKVYNGGQLGIACTENLDGTSNNIRVLVYGSYETT